MTLHELFNTDLKEVNKKIQTDREFANALTTFLEQVGMSLENGRNLWIQADHDLNCPNCRVTVH